MVNKKISVNKCLIERVRRSNRKNSLPKDFACNEPEVGESRAIFNFFLCFIKERPRSQRLNDFDLIIRFRSLAFAERKCLRARDFWLFVALFRQPNFPRKFNLLFAMFILKKKKLQNVDVLLAQFNYAKNNLLSTWQGLFVIFNLIWVTALGLQIKFFWLKIFTSV